MAKAVFYGFNPPFIGGSQNVMSRQEDERLIKNDILQFLYTIPGERTMRSAYGVNLRNFVFEQMDDSSLASLESEITSGLAEHEPRITVRSVSLTPDHTRHGLLINLVCVLKNDTKRLIEINRFIQLG